MNLDSSLNVSNESNVQYEPNRVDTNPKVTRSTSLVMFEELENQISVEEIETELTTTSLFISVDISFRKYRDTRTNKLFIVINSALYCENANGELVELKDAEDDDENILYELKFAKILFFPHDFSLVSSRMGTDEEFFANLHCTRQDFLYKVQNHLLMPNSVNISVHLIS